MNKKQQQENLVRVAEGLKAYVHTALSAWQVGGGSDEKPITLDIAIAHIWDRIDARFQSLQEQRVEAPVTQLRISFPADSDRLAIFDCLSHLDLVSLRLLGSREGSDHVIYAVLRVTELPKIVEIIVQLNTHGAVVRDLTLGC